METVDRQGYDQNGVDKESRDKYQRHGAHGKERRRPRRGPG